MGSPRANQCRVATGVAVLAAAWALTGCGPAGPDPDDAGIRTWVGSTLRIRGFDPVRVGDVHSWRAIAKVYEGLLQYSYLDRPYRVEPLLAEALPEVSDDGLTYTFRIRKGITFQDNPCFETGGGEGRELTAEDFVYSIRRVADLKNQSSGFWAYQDRIEGLDAWRATTGGREPSDYAVPISGLQAVDRYTLRIRLTQPYPQLLWVLTTHYGFAVPHEAVDYYGEALVNHPVGTGPFRLHRWRKNYRIEYLRNPDWGEGGREERYPDRGAPGDEQNRLLRDAGALLPRVDRIVEYVVQDASTQWLLFLQGKLGLFGIARDKMESVFSDSMTLTDALVETGVEMDVSPTMVVRYCGFNMDDPVVGNNPTLRQALACAFDWEQWADFHLRRIAEVVGPVPPLVAGHVERPARFGFDPVRARRLLAEAGYPDGIDPATGKRLVLTLELGVAESPDVRLAVDLFVSFMREIGIDMRAVYNSRASFFDRLDRRQVQMYWLSWVADYPDAENFLQLFYSPNSSPGPNHSNYRNPEVDALYEQLRPLPDSDSRTALCGDMVDHVVGDVPWIPLGVPLAYTLRQPWVRNYKPHDFPYGMEKYWGVDRREAEASAPSGGGAP